MRKLVTYLLLSSLLVLNTSFKNPSKQKFPVLLGVAVKYIVNTGIGNQLMDAITSYVGNFFTRMSQKQLTLKSASRNDVEQITIKITDNDNDGQLEYSTYVEDHDGDGYADNMQSLETEGNDDEETLNSLLKNQLSYIDDFYEGDIDLDRED